MSEKKLTSSLEIGRKKHCIPMFWKFTAAPLGTFLCKPFPFILEMKRELT
jgi:hypothetical protein